MTRRILVTGCNGQIGSKVMTGLKNSMTLKLKGDNVKKVVGLDKREANPDYESIKCDLLNQGEIGKIKLKFEEIDTLVHLASIVETSKSIKDAEDIIKLNVFSTINIINALPKLKHIVFSSSMMVYGKPQKNPINELHPTKPINLYGISKLLTEDAIRIYGLNHPDLKISILRLTSIYGPGNYSGKSSKRAIPNFIRLAKQHESPIIVGKINEKRDYLYIDDAVDAIIKAIENPFDGNINIGSEKSITIKELAALICNLCNSKAKPIIENESLEKDDYLLDISKAKELIGFRPTFLLESGLKKEISNF